MLEEAKKRDHNKLGREMKLFTTVDVIGQGLTLLMPKGGTRCPSVIVNWRTRVSPCISPESSLRNSVDVSP
mgnify:CR=1 FL=1